MGVRPAILALKSFVLRIRSNLALRELATSGRETRNDNEKRRTVCDSGREFDVCRHYSSKEQVAVFQVDKDAVRTLLPILEPRSGKKVFYQDKSAEKKATGGKKETEKPAEKAP